MDTKIKSVLVITPVYLEPLDKIIKYKRDINRVQEILLEKGIGLTHYFLSDGALSLPPGMDTLIKHDKNMGLATTLIDGYSQAVTAKFKPDLIVRMDVDGEHDVYKIPEIVQHMSDRTGPYAINALFLPVWYWVQGQDRPLMTELMKMIGEFRQALFPIKKKKILEIFNQKFPLGFQAYRTEFLSTILPELKKGMDWVEKITGKRATWGLDLLAMIIAAHYSYDTIDFLWGGWATPWAENRPQEKIDNQRHKAEIMVQVAKKMGY